jgi:hypothetical protein
MVHRPGSLILLTHSLPFHGSFSGTATAGKADTGSGFQFAVWCRVRLNASISICEAVCPVFAW